MECFHGEQSTFIERQVGVHNRCRLKDYFGVRSRFIVKSAGSVPGRMLGCHSQSAFCRVFPADAFQNSPRLMQRSRTAKNIVDLVTPQEGSTVDKYQTLRRASQKPARQVKNQLHAEVVLHRGVFDLLRKKQGMPDVVFGDNAAAGSGRQFTRQRRLARTGESSHQYHHAANEFK
jgi:hypothetical protein